MAVMFVMVRRVLTQRRPFFERLSIYPWECKFTTVCHLTWWKSLQHLKDPLSLSCPKFQEHPPPSLSPVSRPCLYRQPSPRHRYQLLPPRSRCAPRAPSFLNPRAHLTMKAPPPVLAPHANPADQIPATSALRIARAAQLALLPVVRPPQPILSRRQPWRPRIPSPLQRAS